MKVTLADGVTSIEANIFGENYNETQDPESAEYSYIAITLPEESNETVETLRSKFTDSNLTKITVANNNGNTLTKTNLKLSGIFDTVTDEGRNLSVRLEFKK